MNTALEVKDLRYRYREGKEALQGVSFSVEKGECVGLIGPNGAGKSTLLLHLNGILPDPLPRESSIFVNGVPVLPDSVHSVRRSVGLLFQNPDDQLFCPTVYEDVAFGPAQFRFPEEEVRSVALTSLATVGLEGFEDRSPHHLSRGEKQRVCLAGILACKPGILVLDEPTSELDPRGKRNLVTLLRTLPTTKIIASHDLELIVELCPRVIVLDGGMIVADGETRAILSDEALMLEHGLEKPHILRHLHPH
ncbi:MAG: ABC transporter ATP-binding protein [Ignavibacteriales bacterium]|nr:ABC transporter ATP-binding protein [Ignavibacteriales bacterium]